MRPIDGLRHIAIVTALAASVAGAPAADAARGWEAVRGERTESRVVARESEIEVRSAPLSLYVSTGHGVQIKIFTILGRLVNSETLQPGTFRLTLPAHGVYIVKAGDLTCKVAV